MNKLASPAGIKKAANLKSLSGLKLGAERETVDRADEGRTHIAEARGGCYWWLPVWRWRCKRAGELVLEVSQRARIVLLAESRKCYVLLLQSTHLLRRLCMAQVHASPRFFSFSKAQAGSCRRS